MVDTKSGTSAFPLWGVVPYTLAALYAWRVGEFSDFNPKIGNIGLAMEYADEFIFHAPLSSHLHKMSRYYLLEPYPTHNETIAYRSLKNPISDDITFGDFSVKNMSDSFYYENVIEYMKKAFQGLSDADIDSKTMAEIECNVNIVIFGEELNKLRFYLTPSREKIDQLISLAETIAAEFKRLWLIDNFEHGIEIFLEFISDRVAELKALKTV